jgi:hypothetical protein
LYRQAICFLTESLIQACTIVAAQVNLLTLATTPTIRLLNILGLMFELSGAVLAVSHLQRQPRSSEGSRFWHMWWRIERKLPTAFVLSGIAMFTAVVVLS